MMIITFSGLPQECAFLDIDDIIITGCSMQHNLKNILCQGTEPHFGLSAIDQAQKIKNRVCIDRSKLYWTTIHQDPLEVGAFERVTSQQVNDGSSRSIHHRTSGLPVSSDVRGSCTWCEWCKAVHTCGIELYLASGMVRYVMVLSAVSSSTLTCETSSSKINVKRNENFGLNREHMFNSNSNNKELLENRIAVSETEIED